MRPHPHVPGTGGTFEVSVTREAPRVDISTTDRPITAQAGAVLIRQATKAVGLARAVGTHLHLKQRTRGFSEEQCFTSIAEGVTHGEDWRGARGGARGDLVQLERRGFDGAGP